MRLRHHLHLTAIGTLALLLAAGGCKQGGSSSKDDGQTFTSGEKGSAKGGGDSSSSSSSTLTGQTVSGHPSAASDDGTSTATDGHGVMNPGAPAQSQPH